MNLLTGAIADKHNATPIGIRPEHLDVVESGGTFTGRVGVAEHLGSDTFFHVHIPEMSEPMTVRAGGEVGLKHGDTIYLEPRAENIHRFDAQGLRIA
jgi:multiple sugar transport system ATP-binding protein